MTLARILAGVSVAILALFVLLLPGSIGAQFSSADVLGTVTDSTGAVLPGATVIVKNTGTGITRTAESNRTGEYLFTGLQIGPYEVTVEAKGFRKFVARNINLTAGDRARVDAKMVVGQASETVNVSAEAAAVLQTDSSTIGTEIPATNIQDVPLSGRNLTDLVLMSAGVQTSVSDSALGNGCSTSQQSSGNMSHPDDCRQGSAYVVNGQSDLNQNNQIDGMDNNDRRIGEVEVKPSIDAIEEVKVQTNLYSAESGRTSGGVVQIVTKSGNNTYKGSVYEYLRNDALDASTTWAYKKNMLRQNQFGATFGGPIIKNKTFFFVDYEGLINHQSVSPGGGGTSIPDQPLLTAVKGGNLVDINAALANDGLGTITSLDPVAQTLMQLFPSNNCTIATTCVYKGNVPRLQNSNTGDIRIDQHINDRNTLYGRYSYNKTYTTSYSSLPPAKVGGLVFTPGATYAEQPEDNISLDYTHIFRSNLILDLKAGYTFSKNFNQPSDPLNDETTLGFDCGLGVTCPLNTASNGARSGLPSISGIGPTGGGGGAPPGGGGPGGGGQVYSYTSCLTPGQLLSPEYAGYSNPSWCSTSWDGLGSGGGGGAGGGPPGGGGGGGWSIGEGMWVPLLIRDDTHQYSASLTWTKGTHSVKFGASLIDRLMEGAQSQSVYGSIGFSATGQSGSPGYVSATANFFEGNAASKSRSFVAVSQHLRTIEPSAYVQDDWRIMPKLTLNLGLRYDLYTPFTEEDGYISNFDPTVERLVSPDLLGTQHSNKYGNVPVDYHDIQPRFGFAYSMPQNMVLRGGFGISYYPGTLGPNSTAVNAPFSYSLSCAWAEAGSGTAFQTPGTVCANVDGTLKGGLPVPDTGSAAVQSMATDWRQYASEGSINSTDTTLKSSSMYQYSMQVQKDWRSNIITAGYVGNLGRHLANYESPNAGVSSLLNNPANGFGMLYPDLIQYTCAAGSSGSCAPSNSGALVNSYSSPSLFVIDTRSNSEYDALQATFLRRSTAGLTTSINYTWAHQLSDGYLINEGGGSNPTCTRYGCIRSDGKGTPAESLTPVGPKQFDKGNSGLDMRHRLTGVVTYQLPFAKNSHGILNAVAGGWTANMMGTLQTGLHTTVADGGGGASGTNRPDVVAGCNPNRKPAGVTSRINEWYDPSCFKLPTYMTMGNEARGLMVEPGMERADVSMIKQFNLHENYKLQVRMESFNITNHPSYDFAQSTTQMACDNFAPSAGSNCGYENLWTAAQAGTVLLNGNPNSCAAVRSATQEGQNSTSGPGSGYPGCIQSTQGINREFQFALKLTF
jgi:hypothetical protein